ncbi:MAG: peptidase S10 [Cyanobacteria bacterium REEB459]|nr:peptidase S10 [Cyanobacteria bacterium REEB459]
MGDSTPDSTQRQGTITDHTLTTALGELAYQASAQWQLVYEQQKPIAELFHVAYIARPSSTDRPLTFVFNGGPGAASAYLHMGALGPRRVCFNADGGLPKPPVRLADNQESWLKFTDLVFIDPLGTGFSRSLPGSQEKAGDPTPEKAKETKPDHSFWEVERDLATLGQFIQAYLSEHHRWLSPIFIAGESYGGFRVAKLTRKLQQEFGVGLCGAILISPVMEFELLSGTDYTLTGWATALPSMAATAAHHGRVDSPSAPEHWAAQAESFARQTLIPFLALGETATSAHRQQVYQGLAALTGLSLEVVQRHRGRLDTGIFARELLRDQQRILGVYDASVTAIDPFPDRLLSEGSDPTLEGIDRIFTGAINSHLRDTLGVSTPLTYHLLNFDVFKAWSFTPEGDFKQGFVGAVDDLRLGMSLNPHMRVAINHGLFDLVTPYFASNFLVDLMALNPELRPNLTLEHFKGGHMFYTWEQSRQQWLAAMEAFYVTAVG